MWKEVEESHCVVVVHVYVKSNAVEEFVANMDPVARELEEEDDNERLVLSRT